MNQPTQSIAPSASPVLLCLSPVLLLLSDVWTLATPGTYAGGLVMSVGFIFFIAGLPTIHAVLAPLHSGFRSAILGCLLIGAVAGASMQVLFRTAILLERGGFGPASEHVLQSGELLVTTRVPGIFFPLGLILAALAILVQGRHPRWIAILLIVGAVCFPVGRILGLEWANLASGSLFCVTFVALVLSSRSASWQPAGTGT